MNLHFQGWIPGGLAMVLALSTGVVIFYTYRKHNAGFWPPLLRALAVGLILLTLGGPILRKTERLPIPAHVQVILDTSESMGFEDEGRNGPRLNRAWTSLIDNGLLTQLATEHEITVSPRDGSIVWKGGPGRNVKVAEEPLQRRGAQKSFPLSFRPVTDLSPTFARDPGNGAGAAIVLLSDGRHNAATDPFPMARELGLRGIPIHTICFGLDKPSPTAALLNVQGPNSVLRGESFELVVDCLDYLPPESEIPIVWEGPDGVLWETTVSATGQGKRRLRFDVEVPESKENIGALHGQIRIGNHPTTQPFHIQLRSRRRLKVLLIDGKPRWDSRYVRDHLERDPKAEVTALLRLPGDELALPSPEEIAAHDIIVFGVQLQDALDTDRLTAIRNLVHKQGRGLVLLDDHSGALAALRDTPLGDLLPVRWLGITYRPEQMTLDGTFLQEEEGTEFYFPAPQGLPGVAAMPGSRVLLEAELRAGDPAPVTVIKPFGAGQVVYIGTDETWRWRARDGEGRHARFWKRLLQVAGEPAYAVQNESVAMDLDTLVQTPGEKNQVRVRLLKADAESPASLPMTVVSADGREQALNLSRDESDPSLYYAHVPDLGSGEHQLRLLTPPRASEGLNLAFHVQASHPAEHAYTAADPEFLRRLSQVSGGTALSETDLASLSGLLAPLRQERVRHNSRILWQSFWWFLPIILLLAIELWLRKKKGLL